MSEPVAAPSTAVSRASAVRFEEVHMVFSSGLRAPVWALRGLTLDVREGAVLGLLGPNGCGKTTAISCMLGLLRPQAGTVSLWGDAVDGAMPFGPARGPGVLLEDTRLPPFLSVAGALETVARVRGLHGSGVSSELERVIEVAGVRRLLDRRIAVLSKGQARRVGLAAALISDPRLLVLDEPSAGLDVSAREEFNELVRNLRDDRRTILIASHLLSDIESTCTHVAIMQDGRVLVHEESEHLLRKARDLNGELDIHVDARHGSRLVELGVPWRDSKYPGLVLLASDAPDHEVLLRLSQDKIVPNRIEPRVNLVSLYLDVTRSGKD